MNQLVERLLKLARIENYGGRLENAEKIDFSELIEELAMLWNERAPARQLSVKLAGDKLFIRGQRNLIKDAVNNLIANAVDFTSCSGRISLKLQQLSKEFLTLKVTDDGCGIPDYAIKQIFDKFYSLPRPDGRKKSSGLGLSLTREIVRLHGGEIVIEPNPDNGTTARLTLPLIP